MAGSIRVGIGGWVFEPWRGTFYPDGLAQKRELEFAGKALKTIEINGTFYGSQKPDSFIKWHEETPEDFVFTLKAPRFATNRKVLALASESIERFFASGVMELKDKLGPINWQFAATKKLELDDFAAFLALLPKSVEGRTLRHAVEVRNQTFLVPEFVALLREHGVAAIVDGDSEYPMLADVTADFVYARIQGTVEKPKAGYTPAALDGWAARAKTWAEGGAPEDLPLVAKAAPKKAREVFLYVISGFKEKNPAAAMALQKRVG